MMLNERSKTNRRVAADSRAGPGNGRPERRPRAQPATGMATRPATATSLIAMP